VLKEDFNRVLKKVNEAAEYENLKPLKDWLRHKDANPWVLLCLSIATTAMSKRDWRCTSMDTNYAESAHALSKRHGVRVSLLSVVMKSLRIDSEQVGRTNAAGIWGVRKNYGGNAVTARETKKINRAVAANKRREKALEESVAQTVGAELMVAETLINKHGLDPSLIEKYLRERVNAFNNADIKKKR